MKKINYNPDSKWKEYAIAGCICVLFYVILSKLGTILGAIGTFLGFFDSIFLGFVIAYILNPLVLWLNDKVFKGIKKEKLRWMLCVVITVLIVLAIIFGLIISIIPQLVDSISVFVNNIENYISRLVNAANNLSSVYGDMIKKYADKLTGEGGLIQTAAQLLKDNLGAILKATGNIGTKATTWAIGFIFAIYFLASKDYLLGGIKRFSNLIFKSVTYTRIAIFLEKFNTIFSKYIVCEILDSLIIGVVNFGFMILLKMPNALFISVICGVTNLIPTFGPIIGLAIGAFILLLVDVSSVLPFIIFTLVLQAADGYVIKPKLFGGALNVPGVLILIAIIIFGKIMGIIGMLIAIPAAAILVYIFDEMLIPYLELKNDLKKYQKEADKADESEREGFSIKTILK